MNVGSLTSKVLNLVSPVVKSLGYDLIEVEYLNEHGRWILRLYIDSEEGVITLGDCEKVSKSISSILDVENVMPGSYALEVSSPGEDRPLRKDKDFKRFTGRIVKIRTREKIGDRRNFSGILKDVKDGVINVEDSGNLFEIPLDKISKARLKSQ